MISRIISAILYVGLLMITALATKACTSSAPTIEPTAVAVVIQTTTPEPPLPTAIPPTETKVPPSPTPAPPTDTAVPASPTAEPEDTATPEPEDTATPEPEDTATPEPEDTPTPEAEEATAGSDNCIACHTSQETLQALAVDTTVESEATSGEG
jgi:outer membrane biosynthesis protein TonB